MFVNFGNGKCPICGDFGSKLSAETFHCTKCEVAFNEFSLSSLSVPKDPEYKMWN